MKQGVGYGDILDIFSHVLAENECTNEEAMIIGNLMLHALVNEEWRMLTEAVKKMQEKKIQQK